MLRKNRWLGLKAVVMKSSLNTTTNLKVQDYVTSLGETLRILTGAFDACYNFSYVSDNA
ncbi:hypothetical protein KEJ18_01885 [Candidatus Bathyarchaeota archaeon]|nr:hypothetical protein [Candidatus Bathyarchaeota archaeon]